METENSKAQVYHERQRLQFCLLHALNNLFQEADVFTRSSLNSVSQKLVAGDPDDHSGHWSPLSVVFKPHHNALTGNYDVNVLIAAVEEKGKAVVWHDKRNGAASICLDGDDDGDDDDGVLFGIVVNVHVKRYIGLWKGRHWVALKKIGGVWYNLDSDLHKPMKFASSDEVREFLDFVMGQGAEVLLVMNKTD